jgi:hypothetical protein
MLAGNRAVPALLLQSAPFKTQSKAHPRTKVKGKVVPVLN